MWTNDVEFLATDWLFCVCSLSRTPGEPGVAKLLACVGKEARSRAFFNRPSGIKRIAEMGERFGVLI